MYENHLKLLEKIKSRFVAVKPEIVRNLGLVYEHKVITSKKPLKQDHKYNIFLLETAKGNRYRLLITKPFVRLPTGEISVFVEHLEDVSNMMLPTEDSRHRLAEALGFKDIRDKNVIIQTAWEQLVEQNRNDPLIFLQNPPFDDKDFGDFIKEFSNEDFVCLFELYQTGDGFKTDERVEYVYRTDLLPFTFGKLSPDRVMKLNPHKITVINTKTRKTTLGRIYGDVLDRASSARFLGFATANDLILGFGNGRWKTTYFDEVDANNKIFIDNIFNYMEIGETTVSVGRENIITRGWSTLTFHSNPQTERNDAVSLYLAFNGFLNLFSEKVPGLASRIAVVLFGNDFKTCEKVMELTHDDSVLIKVFAESLVEKFVPKLEELLEEKKLQQWLLQPLEQQESLRQYKEEIDLILKENNQLPYKIRELWKFQSDSYVHMRGFALKQTFYESTADILAGNVNIENLIEKSEEHLEKLLQINLGSLKKMCGVIPYQTVLLMSYENLPEYCKGLIIATHHALLHNQNSDIGMIELPLLSDEYNKVSSKLPSRFKLAEDYKFFSRIESNLKTMKIEKINGKLAPFEIRLIIVEGKLCVVPNPSWEKILSFEFTSPKNYVPDIKEIFANTKETSKENLESIMPANIITGFINGGFLRKDDAAGKYIFLGIDSFSLALLER